jgi:hypothetical protein
VLIVSEIPCEVPYTYLGFSEAGLNTVWKSEGRVPQHLAGIAEWSEEWIRLKQRCCTHPTQRRNCVGQRAGWHFGTARPRRCFSAWRRHAEPG